MCSTATRTNACCLPGSCAPVACQPSAPNQSASLTHTNTKHRMHSLSSFLLRTFCSSHRPRGRAGGQGLGWGGVKGQRSSACLSCCPPHGPNTQEGAGQKTLAKTEAFINPVSAYQVSWSCQIIQNIQISFVFNDALVLPKWKIQFSNRDTLQAIRKRYNFSISQASCSEWIRKNAKRERMLSLCVSYKRYKIFVHMSPLTHIYQKVEKR